MIDLQESFEDKSHRPEGDGCWAWRAAIADSGYGVIWDGEKTRYAHRVSYELFVGDIPADMQIHHRCMDKQCVNPNHLELVTQRGNLFKPDGMPAINAAKTHCKHGHEYTEENTYVFDTPSGGRGRRCRKCRRIGMREARRDC